jgi:hypothetical protein
MHATRPLQALPSSVELGKLNGLKKIDMNREAFLFFSMYSM